MNKPKMRKLFAASVLALLLVSMFGGLGVWQIKLAHATDSYFGYTTVGSIESYLGSNKKMVSKFTLSEDGEIFQINAYMEADDGNVIGIVYADNAGEPSTRLGYTSSHIVNAGYAWEHFTFTTNVSATAGVYWIGFCADWSPRIMYDSGGSTNQSTYNTDEPTNPDDPFGASIESWDVIFSVYANYTIGAVPTSVAAGSHFGMNDTFKGEGCGIYSDWTSTGCNLEYGVFGSNVSGSFVNSSATALSGTSTWFNKSITLPNVYQIVVQCQIWVNNTAGNTTTTGLFNIYVDQRGYGVTAISGYYKHIQTAVDLASIYGENLTKIPEGTFNFTVLADSGLWSSDIAVSIPAGINVYGAPVQLYPNGSVVQWKTSLQMPYEYPTSGPDYQPQWFQWVLNESNPALTVEVKNIELVGYRYFNQSSSTQYCGFAIYGCDWADIATIGMQNVHVHHCNFQDMCGSAISLQPQDSANYNRRPVSGVIDHCRLVNSGGFGIGVPDEWNDRNLTYGIAIGRWASDVWDDNLSNVFGQYTNYTVIIENNYFSKWRHCVAINHGIHVILRFNIVEGDYGTASFDSHGSYADGSHPDAVGTRCTEIYNNTFKDPDSRYQPSSTWCVNFRGGCGVIYNNTATGYYDLVRLQNDAGNYAPYCPQCHINFTYIWDNIFDGGGEVAKNVYDSILNVNHYLRAPTLIDDGFTYTQYIYPDPIMESGLTESTVEITIVLPTNMTYTTPAVPVQLSASGGTIDTILWNCTYANGTVVYANMVYTTPTTMTLGDGAYIFNAYANNTLGEWDEATVMFTVQIPATPPPPPPSGERKTTLWVEPEYVNTTLEADKVISWCLSHYISQIAIHGDISDENRAYLTSYGFPVFQTTVCTLDPPADYNYTDYMNTILTTYANYSGIIFNDGQTLWDKARAANLTHEEALENYQSFITYAEQILTPHYGVDNVINIACIFSDSIDYALMSQINATQSVFTYYYPPDPTIRYFSNYTWFNTTASGWDVKSFYELYAPANYYQYEGWMLIYVPNVPTDLILKTFNGILDLNQTYAVENIEIFQYSSIVNDTKYSRLLKYLCKMWLEGVSSPILSDAVYTYNWTETYWQELFDLLPANQSAVTYEGWQFTQSNSNFTYAVSDGQFVLFWNGSRSEAGWGSFFMQRAFTSELGLNMTLEFTPVADMISKSIMITEGVASDSLQAYKFGFSAFTFDLNFVFFNVSHLETTINLGKWTPSCSYTIQFNIDMEGCTVKIQNSTWTWTYTIPSNEFRYNSINTRTLLVQATIGNLTDTNTVAWTMDFTSANKLTPWNPPFEVLNYTVYSQDGFYVFLEDGLLSTWTFNALNQSVNVSLYGEANSHLILNCSEPTSVLGDILGYGYLDNKLTIELSAPSSSQLVFVSWKAVYVEPIPPPILFPKGGYYYFITGTRTTNNVTGSKLDSSSGFALSTITRTNAGNCSVSYAFMVSIIKHDGSLVDVTGITAIITRSDLGEGFQNGYATISYTTLALGYQALRVRLYICFDDGAWYASGDYVTEILVEKAVDTSTWNFTVYTKRSLDANVTSAQFMFGDQSHNSRIGNVAFIDPLAQEIALWKLQSGDIVGGVLYPFMLYTGNLIYGLGIMFVSGVLYLRHKKWEVILVCFLLYSGGSGIGYLIPDVAYRLVYIVIWFVLTIVLYRVFR